MAGSPSCVVLYAGSDREEGWLEGMGGVRELYPGVPLLVLGSHLDLGLAWATLKNGADGFVHAMMEPAQVLRAVEVVQKGELHPQAAARVLPEPEPEPQYWGPLGPSTRDLGDGSGGLEQRRDSRAAVPFGIYDQAAPARRLQGAWGAQQDRGGQNNEGARWRHLRERRSRARAK